MKLLPNPWKGVVPYSDDKEDLELHPFRGRRKAISELLTTISNNEITTLYGRSGIGKTSLLNAGVFPKLREIDCYPISIRLFSECADRHYARHIVTSIESLATKHNEDSSVIDDLSQRYLWDYFAYHSFSINDQEVVPIIVLDQFEEILRNTADEALTLLKQIREAKQEAYRQDGTRYEVNFRFVISIREDDLYLLENVIDIHLIDKMKTGRYRLQPIERDAAYEIVFIRDGLFGNIPEAEQKIIADKLIDMTTQDGAISSIMLSLVCSMAYLSSPNDIITLETIQNLGDEPLITFYKESIEGLPNDFVNYLEEEFVDFDRRRSIPKNRIPSGYLPYVIRLADERNNHRILTDSSDKNSKGPSFELLHDKLADAISKYHKERLSDSTKRRIKRWGVAVFAFLLLAFISYQLVCITNKPINYRYLGDLSGEAVPVRTKGYYIKDSVLKLTNCEVKDYTFYGNKEVKQVEMDGVNYTEKGLFLPNAETLVYGSRQWEKKLNTLSFPRIKTIIARRPKSYISQLITLPLLDSAIIDMEDSSYVWWDWKTKTLFARTHENYSFSPVFSRHKDSYHSQIDRSVSSSSKLLVDYDISSNTNPIRTDCFYNLVNSDPKRHSFRRDDIPETILEKVRFVHFQYIDTLCNDAFRNCDLIEAFFPDVRHVGVHAFEDAKINEKLWLPVALTIADSAFFYSSIDSIRLESATHIGKYAFAQKRYQSKAKKIILPQVIGFGDHAFDERVDNNTILSYNKSALFHTTAKETFGGEFFNQELSASNSISISDITRKNGYHVEGRTLIIDSTAIKHLLLSQRIDNISIPPFRKISIDKISFSRKNTSPIYFMWHGNLLSSSNGKFSLVLAPNRERIVSPPTIVDIDKLFSQCLIDRCKEFICLNRNSISILPQTKDVVLYIPFGQQDVYYAYETLFKSVKELSWIETAYYNLFYRGSYFDMNVRNFITSIDIDDIIILFICLVLMMLLWFYFYKSKGFRVVWWRDLLCLTFVLAFAFYIASPYGLSICEAYTTSDGKIFYNTVSLFDYLKGSDSLYVRQFTFMWPALLIAIPLWVAYLYFIRFFNVKRESAKE